MHPTLPLTSPPDLNPLRSQIGSGVSTTSTNWADQSLGRGLWTHRFSLVRRSTVRHHLQAFTAPALRCENQTNGHGWDSRNSHAPPTRLSLGVPPCQDLAVYRVLCEAV